MKLYFNASLLTFLSIFFIAQTGFAKESNSSTDHCMDLSGGLQILSVVGPKEYEADVWGFLTARQTVILKTSTVSFESAGLVVAPKHIWVELSSGAGEQKTVTLKNGFKKSFTVLRESPKCMAYGKTVLARQKKARAADDEVRRKSAEKDKLERDKQIAEYEEHEKLKKAAFDAGKGKEFMAAERAKERAEDQARAEAQAAQDAKDRAERELEGKELDRKMHLWYSKSPEWKLDYCTKRGEKDPQDCANGFVDLEESDPKPEQSK